MAPEPSEMLTLSGGVVKYWWKALGSGDLGHQVTICARLQGRQPPEGLMACPGPADWGAHLQQVHVGEWTGLLPRR